MNNTYEVLKIKNSFTKEWILKRHYAKRKCSISFAYGLFEKSSGTMIGVCTFGYPPNYNFNDGKCVFNTYKVTTLELNRLITEDNLKKNTLSYFVSMALKMLPSPTCIVSYADPNVGHNGYIYQATNWMFTGCSTPKFRYHFEDGATFDIRRGLDRKIEQHGEIINKERLLPTHRYIYLNGSKSERRKMKRDIKMSILPYPKITNTNYDIGELKNNIKIEDI